MGQTPKQAQDWNLINEHVKELQEKFDKIPSPPEPNEGFSEKMNMIYRALEGLHQVVDGRIQQIESAQDWADS